MIEHLVLEARQRSPWEALDLGLVMQRAWRRPVYQAWLGTWGVAVLLLAPLFWLWPVWTAMFLWWLKPLFDRVLLKVFAESAFGEPPGRRQIWRALPQLAMQTGLLHALTLGRFSLARSFHLPVSQLEGATGREARQRRGILSRRTLGYAWWLGFACAHFVVFLEISGVLLIEMFMPADTGSFFDWTDYFTSGQNDMLDWVAVVAWLLAESMVEPYFVAAGFSLYLSRRSDLEGWDMEIAFRRLTRRREVRAGLASIAVLAVTLFLTVSPQPAWAETNCLPPDKPGAPGSSKAQIQQVLSDPVFGCKVADTQWQKKVPDEKKPAVARPWWMKWMIELGRMLAVIGEFAIYIVALLAVVAFGWLLYRNRHLLPSLSGSAIPPGQLFGLDVRPESLPEDVSAAALALLQDGQATAALSLLYRASLSVLLHRLLVDFQPGDTEGDCLRRASGKLPVADLSYFTSLLDAWKRSAYAHQRLDSDSVAALCRAWNQHFARSGAVS